MDKDYEKDYEIEFPQQREELIMSIIAFSNKEYQERAWVKHQPIVPMEMSSFSLDLHILFDDTLLADDISKELETTLKNYDEMHIIKKLICEIDFILIKYGKKLSDEEYINLPEWENVINLAKEATRVFKIDLKDYPEYGIGLLD